MTMKPFGLLITFFLFTSFFAFAQPETGKKAKIFAGFPIVPKPETAVVAPKPLSNNPFSDIDPAKNNEPLFTPNTNIFQDKKKPSFVIGEKRDNILDSKPVFANPNLDVLDKMNGAGKTVSEDFKAIRGNQDLGNFKSSSKFVNIKYRDFGEVDGDEIRVYVNGHTIATVVVLEGFFKGIEITLEPGFNKIDFEALSQGTIGPNTAEFQVYDDKQKLVSSNQWNLVTGFKASIMVFKE